MRAWVYICLLCRVHKCTHACMYICMCAAVAMYVCNVHMDVLVERWVHMFCAWAHGCMCVRCRYACMYVCTQFMYVYGWMYVCMYGWT